MLLTFDVCKQKVEQTLTDFVVNRSVNVLKLKFTFKGTEWDNLTKHCLFYSRSKGVYCDELDNNSEIVVPFEVLENDYFVFSLFGIGEDVRYTTNRMKVYLKESGYVGDGIPPGQDSKTIIEKVYDAIDEVSDDISGVSGDVTTLSSKVDGIDDDVKDLDTGLTAVTGRVGTLETNTGTLSGTVDGLSNTVTDLSSDVSDAKTSIGTINGNITTINGKLDNTIEMEVTFTDQTTATYNVVVKEDESN